MIDSWAESSGSIDVPGPWASAAASHSTKRLPRGAWLARPGDQPTMDAAYCPLVPAVPNAICTAFALVAVTSAITSTGLLPLMS